MPKFSIIIPVYNVAPYLRECLDSVLAQTFADWEAICVDDGSTDGSGAILDGYAAKDRRFRVIHQANAGVSAARNAALDVAQGEWICFVDADDVVGFGWLCQIAHAANMHPMVDWIRTRYRDLIEGQVPKPWPKESINFEEAGVYDSVSPMMWHRLDKLGMPWLNIFKRDAIGDLRFEVGLKLYEDIGFCAKMIGRTMSFCVVPDDEYYYRMRHSSASHGFIQFYQIHWGLSALLSAWGKCPGCVGSLTLRFRKCIMWCYNSGCRISFPESLKMRHLLFKYWRSGAFAFREVPSRKLKIRWALFLLTGLSWCLWGSIHRRKRSRGK